MWKVASSCQYRLMEREIWQPCLSSFYLSHYGLDSIRAYQSLIFFSAYDYSWCRIRFELIDLSYFLVPMPILGFAAYLWHTHQSCCIPWCLFSVWHQRRWWFGRLSGFVRFRELPATFSPIFIIFASAGRQNVSVCLPLVPYPYGICEGGPFTKLVTSKDTRNRETLRSSSTLSNVFLVSRSYPLQWILKRESRHNLFNIVNMESCVLVSISSHEVGNLAALFCFYVSHHGLDSDYQPSIFFSAYDVRFDLSLSIFRIS